MVNCRDELPCVGIASRNCCGVLSVTRSDESRDIRERYAAAERNRVVVRQALLKQSARMCGRRDSEALIGCAGVERVIAVQHAIGGHVAEKAIRLIRQIAIRKFDVVQVRCARPIRVIRLFLGEKVDNRKAPLIRRKDAREDRRGRRWIGWVRMMRHDLSFRFAQCACR